MKNESVKIVFADDKQLWRKNLVEDLLPFNIQCIGEADNGVELLEILSTVHPDVVLLDLRMPVMDGNHALQAIQERYPGTRVIILSMHDDAALIDDFMARGVWGYIPKDAVSVEVLATAIQRVKNESKYIHKSAEEHKKYTPRQIELIPLVCEGMTNREIAEEIGITERGVEKLRQKIYAKTGVKKAVDFYKYAFLQGLDFLNRPRSKKKK